MSSVVLKAHYDGEAIRLDEPYVVPENATLFVTIVTSDESLAHAERTDWADLAARGLAGAYGDDEQEYTTQDLIP